MRTSNPSLISSPPRVAVIASALVVLLATLVTPAAGHDHLDIHCPGEDSGAPDGAIEESSGEDTVDGVIATWGGDPGSVEFENTNDVPATITWCAKGGDDFDGDGSMNLGEQTTTLAPGEEWASDDFGTEISYFVVYDVELDEGPDPVDITLVKEWFDADGAATDAPDTDWGVEMASSPDGEVVASVPGDDHTATFPSTYDLDTADWVSAAYDVTETALPEGWEEVPCEEVDTTTEAVATGTGTDFEADADGVHLVCNQEIAEEEPETFSLTIGKVWLDGDGEVTDEPDDVDWTVELLIDDDTVASLPGDDDTYTTTDLIDGYTVTETVSGYEVVDCPAEVLTGTGAGADGTGDFEGDADGLHLVCNAPDVDVLPIVIEQPDDDPEPTPTTDEVEVLAEVVTAETSTLPRTGLETLALALLGSGLLALGAAAVAGSRRREVTARWW